MKLTAISKYPVKSLKGVSLSNTKIDDFGIENDRRWMLVDDAGRFITQRKYPLLGTISVEDSESNLIFTDSNGQELRVDFNEFVEPLDVHVWGDGVPALKAGNLVSEWFSGLIGTAAHLVYMPDFSFRQVDRQFADYQQRVGFADAFPFLLISDASLDDLNQKLEKPINMSRFRPNLVVSGCSAYEEDRWKKIRIGDVEFSIVKPCSRCIMTTIDESTLRYSKEPLKTLAGYRKNEFGVCFGQNLVHQSQGVVSLGETVEVLEWA